MRAGGKQRGERIQCVAFGTTGFSVDIMTDDPRFFQQAAFHRAFQGKFEGRDFHAGQTADFQLHFFYEGSVMLPGLCLDQGDDALRNG